MADPDSVEALKRVSVDDFLDDAIEAERSAMRLVDDERCGRIEGEAAEREGKRT